MRCWSSRRTRRTICSPTPPNGCSAIAARSCCKRGNLAGLGPIEVMPDGGILPDAEIAARIVLTDVAQCTELHVSRRPSSGESTV
jgi:hypothetical protein